MFIFVTVLSLHLLKKKKSLLWSSGFYYAENIAKKLAEI